MLFALPWAILAGPLLAAVAPAAAQGTSGIDPDKPDGGVSVYPFKLNQVQLTSSRLMDNQGRAYSYLKFVDVNRLLYVFRANHNLSTNGAASNGGWDSPTFPFRSHVQGHFLSAFAQCYAVTGDQICKTQATTMTAAMVQCQNNNAAAGFGSGYLSGFPESDFTALEARTLSNGNVPYYCIHKTLAGLLDVWRLIGDANAKAALLALAGWVDTRTSKLSTTQMQNMLGTEFGGMNEVLADIYFQTGDSRWLTVAARFDHATVFAPLAANRDELNGLHANTQVPKWIGAAREFKATDNATYRTIAANAWAMTTNAHSYAIGGNSKAEHFNAPNAISGYLTADTAEGCNSYNMLKLTRELFALDPSSTAYFDFYERTLMNHLLGQQNPSDSHGHITYFTGLSPGVRRGLGPAWGGGTYSTDYDSFWCCQGTGIETNTKLMDSIYWYDNSNNLYVNLFAPSRLSWAAKGVQVTQSTSFPFSDTTTLTISGSGTFGIKVRIPSWARGAYILVNGVYQSGITTISGTYAQITSRTWSAGNTITVRLPMCVRTVAANDNATLAAVLYGPIVLIGNYGSKALSSAPTIQLSTIKRTDTATLAFTATANEQRVNLGPFYDGQGFNYVTYWTISGSVPSCTIPKPRDLSI